VPSGVATESSEQTLLLLLLLLQDHLNDILSNLCAIITAILAGVVANGWWVDPVGAVAISLYIVARWLAIAKQQVRGGGALAMYHLFDV
jgi:divalent metal cation (Fe/Co/Zn/Cd) transporter